MYQVNISFKKLFSKIPYKVVHILSFVVDFGINNNRDYFYRVLLSDLTNEGYYKILQIPPYMLNAFTLGNIVRVFNENTEIKETGQVITVSLDIESYKNQIIKTIGEVLTEEEYPLNLGFTSKSKTVSFKEEIKQQYCVIVEKDNINYVFPVAVIGSKFFFISPKFTNNLFNISLESEYHKVDVNGKSIHLKGGFNNIDAPFLYLYATNPLAKKVYESVGKRITTRFQGKNNNKTFKFPLKETIFPFSAKDVEFILRGEFLSKNKFLVYSIEKLDFSKILGTKELTILRTGKDKNQQFKIFFDRKKDSKSTKQINDDLKADHNEYFENLENSYNDLLSENLNIIKKEIPNQDKGKSVKGVISPEKSDEVKDLTFNRYGNNLEPSGKGIDVKIRNDLEDLKELRGFSFEDFLKYFKEVCNECGIDTNKISQKVMAVQINKVVNPKISLIHFKFKKPRKYLILEFFHNEKYLTILEIDHSDISDDSNKLYTLIFSGNRKLSDNEIFYSIHSYLDKSKSLGKIENYFKNKNFIFYKKRHPRDYNIESIKDWIETFINVLKYKLFS